MAQDHEDSLHEPGLNHNKESAEYIPMTKTQGDCAHFLESHFNEDFLDHKHR